jgi:hypothetical protein
VVSLEGVTETEPAETGVVDPMPLSIEMLSTLLVVQLSFVESPFVSEVSSAVSVHAGAGVVETVMGAEHVTVPPGPDAVRR